MSQSSKHSFLCEEIPQNVLSDPGGRWHQSQMFQGVQFIALQRVVRIQIAGSTEYDFMVGLYAPRGLSFIRFNNL